jgi:hypothetical protein
MRKILAAMGLILALVVTTTFVMPPPNETDPPSLVNALSAPVEAQVGGFVGYHATATAQTAVGATSAISMRGIATNHSIGLVVTGAPATCTYRLQGSRDGTNWFDISASAITCTSTILSTEANKPFPRVRGNLVTLTGGTAPTVTLHYVGK